MYTIFRAPRRSWSFKDISRFNCVKSGIVDEIIKIEVIELYINKVEFLRL